MITQQSTIQEKVQFLEELIPLNMIKVIHRENASWVGQKCANGKYYGQVKLVSDLVKKGDYQYLLDSKQFVPAKKYITKPWIALDNDTGILPQILTDIIEKFGIKSFRVIGSWSANKPNTSSTVYILGKKYDRNIQRKLLRLFIALCYVDEVYHIDPCCIGDNGKSIFPNGWQIEYCNWENELIDYQEMYRKILEYLNWEDSHANRLYEKAKDHKWYDKFWEYEPIVENLQKMSYSWSNAGKRQEENMWITIKRLRERFQYLTPEEKEKVLPKRTLAWDYVTLQRCHYVSGDKIYQDLLYENLRLFRKLYGMNERMVKGFCYYSDKDSEQYSIDWRYFNQKGFRYYTAIPNEYHEEVVEIMKVRKKKGSVDKPNTVRKERTDKGKKRKTKHKKDETVYFVKMKNGRIKECNLKEKNRQLKNGNELIL